MHTPRPFGWKKVLVSFGFLGVMACTHDSNPPVPLQMSLYGGIPNVAKIGDPIGVVAVNPVFKVDRTPVDPNSDEGKLGLTDVISMPDVGTRVFFRKELAVMIGIKEPFPGTIEGKDIKAFGAQLPQGKDWEDMLIQHFGQPTARASGGKLGSNAFFYGWGDVTYNKVGPIEFALYQAPDIANFRQKNFAKDIQIFRPH